MLTDTHISVYGKTIGIIGEHQDVADARTAVENMLKGAPHGNVYKWLEKRRKERKELKL